MANGYTGHVNTSQFDPLSALDLIQGLTVLKSREQDDKDGVDLVVDVEVGRTPLVLAIELKKTLDPRSVDRVLARLGNVPQGRLPMVAAPYVAPGIRRRLEAGGVGWLDSFGNAHIEDPARGVVVHVERPIPRGEVPRPRGRLFGSAAGRVTQALIEEVEPRDLSHLAKRARVQSLSTVSRALSRLEEDDLVVRERDGWIVSDKTTLLDAWLDAKLRVPQGRPSVSHRVHRILCGGACGSAAARRDSRCLHLPSRGSVDPRRRLARLDAHREAADCSIPPGIERGPVCGSH
jgi:DNA-binding transcriptional ArsR family regulator